MASKSAQLVSRGPCDSLGQWAQPFLRTHSILEFMTIRPGITQCTPQSHMPQPIIISPGSVMLCTTDTALLRKKKKKKKTDKHLLRFSLLASVKVGSPVIGSTVMFYNVAFMQAGGTNKYKGHCTWVETDMSDVSEYRCVIASPVTWSL